MKDFDKYHFYKQAVQDPVSDLNLFSYIYKRQNKKKPRVFREDFCGTFYNSWSWVKRDKKNKALVIDKEKEPLEYGKKHHKLDEEEKSRLKIINKDLLKLGVLKEKADIISVCNFSLFFIHDRKSLIKYFQSVRKSLKKKGMFIFDSFGGPDAEEEGMEKRIFSGFEYYWDQVSFDPCSRIGKYYIHFKIKNKWKKKVFSYEFRLWTLPELKEALKDAGFKNADIYWDTEDKKKSYFKKIKACDDSYTTWIAYLVAY